MVDEAPFTWNQVVCIYPHFCQWIVNKFGPLPDGTVKRVDYERFSKAYNEST